MSVVETIASNNIKTLVLWNNKGRLGRCPLHKRRKVILGTFRLVLECGGVIGGLHNISGLMVEPGNFFVVGGENWFSSSSKTHVLFRHAKKNNYVCVYLFVFYIFYTTKS